MEVFFVSAKLLGIILGAVFFGLAMLPLRLFLPLGGLIALGGGLLMGPTSGWFAVMLLILGGSMLAYGGWVNLRARGSE